MASAEQTTGSLVDHDFLGPLSRRVMGRLWEAGPQTVGQVQKGLNAASNRPLAYTTVLTILTRMHRRGYVTRVRTGRQYEYRAALDEAALTAEVGRQELRRLIERYGASSLATFAADLNGVEPDLVDRLRRLAGEAPE